MQDQIKKDFSELYSINDRGLELLSEAKEILEKGVSEEMIKKIESEEIN